MAEKIEKDILDISTPWEGYSGEFVEKFIKKLFGELATGETCFLDRWENIETATYREHINPWNL